MFNLLAVNVSAIVDVVVIVTIIVFAVLGFARGFVQTFFKIFGTVLALLFAVLLASKVTLFMEKSFGLVSWVGGGLEGVLNRIFGGNVMNTTLKQATQEFLTEQGVGNWLIDIIIKAQQNSSIPVNTTLNQIICPSFAYYIAMVLVVIILFILFKLIFLLVGKLVEGLHDIKLIGIPDKLLGLALGILYGFVIVEIVIMIVGIIPIGIFKEIHVAATGSGFTGFIHRINVFSLILNAFAKADVITVIKNIVSSI